VLTTAAAIVAAACHTINTGWLHEHSLVSGSVLAIKKGKLAISVTHVISTVTVD